jgi:hypothetical protein
VAGALDAAAPRGPAAPYWIGLDRPAFDAQLAELRQWADTVLRRYYGGYELRDCRPSHLHAIWELSTLAAAWQRAYGGQRPDLARALKFYDRWLPGTMRRIAYITRTCVPECVTRRRPWWRAPRPQPLPKPVLIVLRRTTSRGDCSIWSRSTNAFAGRRTCARLQG